MKRLISSFLLVYLLTACRTEAKKPEIFAQDGKAILGYDPVAFFKKKAPVAGADSLSYTWKGAEWLFSSRENLENFKSNPEQFAPQYGGYCAFGTAAGHKAPTETNTWTILDDKLYFNYNADVKAKWVKDQKALIEKADKNWPELKDK